MIKKAFEDDPALKMTKLLKRKKISVATVFRAVKSEEGKSLRHLKKPLLSAAMLQKHQEQCHHLLNDFKSYGNWIIIFSDEKTFTVDLVMNKQNKHVASFGKDISEVCNVSATKHLASVIMLGVMVSNGEKMPPVWFDIGYRLTATDCKAILATKALPWVRKITKNVNYVFQQDGAPAHTAKVIQE